MSHVTIPRRKTFAVTLIVDVDDAAALKSAAEQRAISEGQTAAQWAKMRAGTADDLQMLLDPGSIPGSGISIDSSDVDAVG